MYVYMCVYVCSLANASALGCVLLLMWSPPSQIQEFVSQLLYGDCEAEEYGNALTELRFLCSTAL